MQGWLVGCQFNIQGFPSGKDFVPQTVVWYKFLVKFFLGGKKKGTKKKGRKQKDCVALDFTLLPEWEAE